VFTFDYGEERRFNLTQGNTHTGTRKKGYREGGHIQYKQRTKGRGNPCDREREGDIF